MDSRKLVYGVLELCVRGGRDIHSTRRLGPDLLHFMLHIFPFYLIANLGSGVTRYPGFSVSLFANCRACAIMSKHAGCDDDGLCRPKIGYCASPAAACAWLPTRRLTFPHVLFSAVFPVVFLWVGAFVLPSHTPKYHFIAVPLLAAPL